MLCRSSSVLRGWVGYGTNNATAQANVAKPNSAAESRRPPLTLLQIQARPEFSEAHFSFHESERHILGEAKQNMPLHLGMYSAVGDVVLSDDE